MPAKPSAKRPEIPAAPVLDGASAPLVKAFARAIGKHKFVDSMANATRALGALLAKDDTARAHLHAVASELAHGLAVLGKIELLGPKTRIAGFERVHQLEMLLLSLRSAGSANDAPLIALAADIPDGPIRGRIAEVLRGGQIVLPRTADPALASLFETSHDPLALRCSFGALWEHDEQAARAAVRRILEAGTDEALVVCVLDQLEHAEQDHASWTALVAPLALSDSRTISIYASRFFTKQAEAFRGFIAWAQSLTDPAEQRRAVAVLAPQAYWAYVSNRELRRELGEPLRLLRDRAVATKDHDGVKAIDAVAKKSGFDLGIAPTPTSPSTKPGKSATTAKTPKTAKTTKTANAAKSAKNTRTAKPMKGTKTATNAKHR